ncbi:MAG: prephenate dehydratase [Myxococcales bacterium]|nr:prephenate dehydratase [Myxococcales bacterium]
MKSLSDLRSRIDALDEQLLALLDERARVAKEVAVVKRAVMRRKGPSPTGFHDPEREQAVLDRLASKGAGAFPRGAIRAVFREVMSACLSVEEPLTVAFLGPEGTYTQMAARGAFGLAARYRDCATIEAVFDAVQRREAVYGVVPIENSSEGAVSMTTDALIDGDLLIRREVVLPVSHCLLTHARRTTAISRVFSHPQALAQCRAWLAKHAGKATLVHTPSTAAAAREASTDPTAAAIGSALAGELYGLPALETNIQDRRENATRFVVVGAADAPRTGADRTTIVFSVPHERGALRRALSEFEAADANLTRIESRPHPREPWSYVFLVDVEGHRTDPPLERVLRRLRRSSDFVKVMGSYPRAPSTEAPPKKKKRRRSVA